MMDKRYGERSPGYLGAFWAHLTGLLAFPHFFLWMISLAWGMKIPGFEIDIIPTNGMTLVLVGKYFRFITAVVPLAPFITYILYSWQRRKIETGREQEWARFQTMQALLFQAVVLVAVALVDPNLPLVTSFFSLMVSAIVVAMLIYALYGAISMLIGKEDFSYPGVGRLARKIVQGRYRKR